jgi:hypothetical protein
VVDAPDTGGSGIPPGVVGEGGHREFEADVVGSGTADRVAKRRLRVEGPDGSTDGRTLLEEVGDDTGSEVSGGPGDQDGVK